MAEFFTTTNLGISLVIVGQILLLIVPILGHHVPGPLYGGKVRSDPC
mgnify:CR=1 FL=1